MSNSKSEACLSLINADPQSMFFFFMSAKHYFIFKYKSSKTDCMNFFILLINKRALNASVSTLTARLYPFKAAINIISRKWLLSQTPFQVQCSGSDCTKTKLNVAIKIDHEREGQRDIQYREKGWRRYSQQLALDRGSWRSWSLTIQPKHDKSFPHVLQEAVCYLKPYFQHKHSPNPSDFTQKLFLIPLSV